MPVNPRHVRRPEAPSCDVGETLIMSERWMRHYQNAKAKNYDSSIYCLKQLSRDNINSALSECIAVRMID